MLEKAIAFEYFCWCECSVLPGQCDLILCAMDYLWETQQCRSFGSDTIDMDAINFMKNAHHLKREIKHGLYSPTLD